MASWLRFLDATGFTRQYSADMPVEPVRCYDVRLEYDAAKMDRIVSAICNLRECLYQLGVRAKYVVVGFEELKIIYAVLHERGYCHSSETRDLFLGLRIIPLPLESYLTVTGDPYDVMRACAINQRERT